MGKRGPKPVPLADRFWTKARRAANGCLEWQAHIGSGGYGRVAADTGGSDAQRKGPRDAHRVAWELVHGKVPDGMCVCHRCDNPRCVDADHLFLGVQRDNVDDMVAKGRQRAGRSPGEAAGTHKLADEGVLAMRSAYASGRVTQVELALAFGVHQTTVSSVVRRRAWCHLR